MCQTHWVTLEEKTEAAKEKRLREGERERERDNIWYTEACFSHLVLSWWCKKEGNKKERTCRCGKEKWGGITFILHSISPFVTLTGNIRVYAVCVCVSEAKRSPAHTCITYLAAKATYNTSIHTSSCFLSQGKSLLYSPEKKRKRKRDSLHLINSATVKTTG